MAASTSASADAEDLTTSGDCSNANFAPKYNSQELDKESQFYYFNARHYDPELARFVTADVMVDGEDTAFGWNRYMYVHGNPIMYKDPSGHFEIVEGTIEKGDTLSKIATDITKEYGQKVGVKGLLKLNPQIKNPDKIFIGDKLNIPFKLQGMEGGFSNPFLKVMVVAGQSDDVRKVISLSKHLGATKADSYSSAFDMLNNASSQVSPNNTANRDLLSFCCCGFSLWTSQN